MIAIIPFQYYSLSSVSYQLLALFSCIYFVQFIYLFICLFIYLFVYLFIYLFMSLFIHSFVYLFIYLFIYLLFIYLFIWLICARKSLWAYVRRFGEICFRLVDFVANWHDLGQSMHNEPGLTNRVKVDLKLIKNLYLINTNKT